MTLKRPLLAETLEDLAMAKLPVFVSPKLDGVRCLKTSLGVVSRAFKPIPNKYVRERLQRLLPDGVDGELMVEGFSFNQLQSAIMSEDGEPQFSFHAFDYVGDDLTVPFRDRFVNLCHILKSVGDKRLHVVPHVLCVTLDEVRSLEALYVGQGYEGVMLRNPSGPYKCGRSTLKEAILLKYKRFKDSEAVVVGFKELLRNQNQADVSELGLTKRSKKKAGMVGADTLGSFLLKDAKTGVDFECGTGDGLTQEMRRDVWAQRERHVGKLVKYKYQEAGPNGKPRFPVFLGFRDESDV